MIDEPFAPLMSVAPAYHSYVSGAAPLAVMLSVADSPEMIVRDCGCAEIAGASQPCVTGILVPATSIEPLRAAPPFAATTNEVAPLPVPLVAPVMVIHGVLVKVVQEQAGVVVMVMLPLPAAGVKSKDAGETL